MRRPPLLPLLLLALLVGRAAADAPAAPPPPTVRIVVLADVNGPYGATSYAAAVHEAVRRTTGPWAADLVLLPGDVVAGQSAALPEERFAEMWSAFDRDVAGPLRAAGIPYAFAVGNHDASSLPAAGGGYAFPRERDAARRYWTEARHEAGLRLLDGEARPFRYSFVAHGVFVAAIDASSARLPDGTEAWLARELARPEATGARLRLVMGHLPAFGVAEGKTRPGEVLARGAELLELLARLGVDAYVSGHHAAFFPGLYRPGPDAGAASGVRLVHAGGVGGRRLLGSGAPARPAAVLLEVTALPGGEAELRARGWDLAAGRWIAPEELPERIEGIGGTVWRAP